MIKAEHFTMQKLSVRFYSFVKQIYRVVVDFSFFGVAVLLMDSDYISLDSPALDRTLRAYLLHRLTHPASVETADCEFHKARSTLGLA